MGLRTSPISRNLRMNVRFLGLEVEDLFVITGVGIFFLIVGQFIFPHATIMKLPANWALFGGTILIGVPFLSAFKYGKPRGYLNDFIMWYIKPKKRDCFSRDTKMTEPYLKDIGEEQEKKKDAKEQVVKKQDGRKKEAKQQIVKKEKVKRG
jgi:hypothetical protein